MSLSARQSESLIQKQALIRHVLDEAAVDGDMAELKHRLDDFLHGHEDLALTLRSGADEPLYRSSGAAALAVERRSQFEVPFSPPGASQGAQSVTATLTLDTRSDKRLLQQLAFTLFAAATIGALLVSLGGFLLVRRGLTPVRDLVEQTRHLAADTLRQRLDGSAQPDELQPLVEQFNALLHRLNQAYEQLEGFNADVAHELCTPLATLISATELALRKTRSDDELRDVLGSNLEELRRLSGIVHDMLFLSHADRGAMARREAAPSLAAVAAAVVEYHEAALEDAHVSVQIVGDAQNEVDVALVRRALSNLVGNATRYATRGSTVRVDIAEQPGGQVRIAVINQGATIAAEQLPRLFDRFFRGDSARSDAGSHHGLGLAIVAAIARMHGGRPVAHSDGGVTTIGRILGAAPSTPAIVSPTTSGSAVHPGTEPTA
jgi:two-component system heavy metal sensor histidine kinase CusS